jgi:hypothetical protein
VFINVFTVVGKKFTFGTFGTFFGIVLTGPTAVLANATIGRRCLFDIAIVFTNTTRLA